jgi:molybdopterin synthase catalytic subunit
MVEIIEAPIDCQQVLEHVQNDLCGASVLFIGSTRQFTDGRETSWLEYECYQTMALKKLSELCERAHARWPIHQCAIVHRVGRVPIGQPSVAVAVSSPHRQDAFAAAQWLIDTLKHEVPIWKKEIWADGSQSWIHPNHPLQTE